MKKILFALFGLSMMIVLSGCPRTTRQTTASITEEPQQQTQELKRNLDLWDAQFTVHYGDPISFFNEFKITTSATSKSAYIYKMEDGIVKRIPSSKFTFTIPANTSGIISKLGTTTENKVNVCFFPGDDTYVTFSKRSGMTGFYLEPNATVVVDNIPYTIEVEIKGSGDGKCRLYFDFQEEENPNDENKVATGIVPSGTKEIIVK